MASIALRGYGVCPVSFMNLSKPRALKPRALNSHLFVRVGRVLGERSAVTRSSRKMRTFVKRGLGDVPELEEYVRVANQ